MQRDNADALAEGAVGVGKLALEAVSEEQVGQLGRGVRAEIGEGCGEREEEGGRDKETGILA